ncbi:hypothetical protein U1Q18_010261, partial [Sarracenia purpurea var. burkii]
GNHQYRVKKDNGNQGLMGKGGIGRDSNQSCSEQIEKEAGVETDKASSLLELNLAQGSSSDAAIH